MAAFLCNIVIWDLLPERDDDELREKCLPLRERSVILGLEA